MSNSHNPDPLAAILEYMEWIVRKLLLVGAAVIIFTQAALTMEHPRQILSYVDRLEGNQIYGEQIRVAEAPLEIQERTVTAPPRLTEEPEARLLLISQLDALPSDKVIVRIEGKEIPLVNGELAVRMREGQSMEIDSSAVARTIKFIVATPQQDIEFPASGFRFESRSNSIVLGPIRFKHQ